MSEPTAVRAGRMGAWLSVPALLGVLYVAAYYATVVPVEYRIQIRSGSTRVLRLDAPEPSYSIRFQPGRALPTRFWQNFFVPAWHVDRALRPGVWGARGTATAAR